MDSSDDDDWFYGSIKRYKTLLMFDFSTATEFIEINNEESVSLVFEAKNGHNEMSCMSLPKKLRVTKEQERLEKDSDFQVLSGGFSSKPLLQMKMLYGMNTMLTSEEGQCGLNIYKIPLIHNSGIIHHTETVCNNITSPSIAFNKFDTLAVVDKINCNTVLVSVKEFVVQENVKMNDQKDKPQIYPEFLSRFLLGLCDRETGITRTYDTRSGTVCHSFLADHLCPKSQWTLSSSFQSTPHIADNTDETKLSLLSTSGIINVHDIRYPQHPMSCEKGNDLCTYSNKIFKPKLCFAPDSLLLSVSGFDKNIYIYDFTLEKMKKIFIHDGHHRKSCFSECVTTDHIWYKDTVISACDNFSVHCWQFSL